MPSRLSKKLSRSFYDRSTLEVAPDLLGKSIVFHSPEGMLSARITEVEAYIGQDDPACHAARGRTERNSVMFGPPGFSYVYFIYGMYHCLNFVTESEGKAAAVLLRAAEPDAGLDVMLTRSTSKKRHELLNGPGKFCRAFGLSRDHNALDLTGDTLYLEDRFVRVAEIGRSPRIGIKTGTGRLWRFFDKQARSVSSNRVILTK